MAAREGIIPFNCIKNDFHLCFHLKYHLKSNSYIKNKITSIHFSCMMTASKMPNRSRK